MSVEFLETPESRFSNLPGFPYTPNFVQLPSSKGLRLSFIDERTSNYTPGKSRVFLCLHGVPTYSYLYRNIIPVLLASDSVGDGEGVRVVCPDMIGFGRSDKPTLAAGTHLHTFAYHRQSMIELIEHLRLSNVTLVVQDWGGLIGLTLPMDVNNTTAMIIKRVVLFNTYICDGSAPSAGFLNWRRYASTLSNKLNCGQIVNRGTYGDENKLSAGEMAAYNAPFVDASYLSAIRMFPQMVAIHPSDPGMDVWRRAWFFWKANKAIPVKHRHRQIALFMAHGCRDPVFGTDTALTLYQHLISDTVDAHLGTSMENGGILWIPDGGHFLQECKSRITFVVERALKFFGDIAYAPVEYEWLLTTKYNFDDAQSANATAFAVKADERVRENKSAHILKVISNFNRVHPLSPAVIASMRRIFETFEENDDVRGYILTSFTLPRIRAQKTPFFCAGLDLKTMQKNDPTIAAKYLLTVRDLWRVQHCVRKPLIGAINGHAIAGGALLALIADYRIAYKDTVFQMIESRIGLGASASVVQQIRRVVGSDDRTGYVLQTSMPFANEKALEYNLFNEICSDDSNLENGYDRNLMNACVHVLESQYFYAQLGASASAKMGARHSTVESFKVDTMFGGIAGGTNNFLSGNVQKYIKSKIKSNL